MLQQGPCIETVAHRVQPVHTVRQKRARRLQSGCPSCSAIGVPSRWNSDSATSDMPDCCVGSTIAAFKHFLDVLPQP
jgi:hypothetical protein